jgi:hypothetical protein
MTTSQMQEFARMGAEARLTAIQEEQQAILRVFPELRDGTGPDGRTSAPAPRGRRRRMSAAERRAVGKRMKAYWAARRAAKPNGAGEGTQSKTAGQNGAATSKRAGKTRRKQGGNK